MLRITEGAATIFQEYCRNIATQIINLQTILDPENFVIGGGISANPLLVVTIKEELEKLYLDSILNFVRADIEQSKLGNEANLLGAIYNYKQTHDLEV
ncbi:MULTISPECIES: ROK family protein [Paenibacillus]|uniref:ROK family protein n=1 Tax=Paenibacillus TaxID=44249 RepID=UPI0021AD3B31|nr:MULTISPECIES: ROK family protein [Paenibacillus]QYK67662.1 ROK family protein [Paenibacillus sp. S02]WCM59075.1 ROK family protein [Paenibacillus polymyxa]